MLHLQLLLFVLFFSSSFFSLQLRVTELNLIFLQKGNVLCIALINTAIGFDFTREL